MMKIKIEIKRKHKIAAIVLVAVVFIALLLDSVLAKRPVLSFSSKKSQNATKLVKAGKTISKKGKASDANQAADSNSLSKSLNKTGAASAALKKSAKSVDKTVENIDANSPAGSTQTEKTFAEFKDSKAAKDVKPMDTNQAATDSLQPAEDIPTAIVVDANDVIQLNADSLAGSNKIVDNNSAEVRVAADSNVSNVNKSMVMPDIASTVGMAGMNLQLPRPQTVKSEPAELALNLDSVKSGIQSLVFMRNMPIIDALQLVAAKYNKNIIPMTKVSGTLGFTKLNNVSFDEAMTAILGKDYQYEQQGSLIKVYSRGESSSAEMICKVFTLYYITAEEAKKLVTPVVSKDGKVEITSPAQTGVPVDETISAPTGAGNSIAINDILVMYDYPDRVAKAEQIIAAADVRPKQVLIEATILTATLTNGMQLGIDWQNLERSVVTALSGVGKGSNWYVGVSGTSTYTGTSSLTGGMTIGVTQGNVAAFIKAIESITDVTILANPKILAANKQLGQVYIGKKVAYVSQTTQSGNNDSITQKVEFLETGTKLSFRPYIGDDGYIRMDIHPKDSSATASQLNAELPDETSAELVSNIMVRDGETIVIGGLFRDKVTAKKTQVPVLGSIPIVGAAFSSHADESLREEVIILLTPHIIAEPNKADGAERAEDVARKIAGAKDELAPSRIKLAQEHYEKAAVLYARGKNFEALRELRSALQLYPSYIEAIQLEERIYNETDPKKKPVRKIVEKVEKQSSSKWRRK